MVVLNRILCVFELALLVTSSPIHNADDDPERTKGEKSDEFLGITESGSDIGLYNRGLHQGDIYHRRSRALDLEVDVILREDNALDSSLWPHGVVIYKVDEKIGCPDSAQCELLMRAMTHYHTHSCIRFQEWTGEESYVQIFFNPDSGACWSAVGRMGGQQLLSLGRRCWYHGIVVHELGHSVGFEHEMNRPDRDDYINIIWENILPGFADAFDKQSSTSYKTLNEQFDYRSIMMYDEFAFAKDKNSPTIEAKDKTVIGPIWRKPGLSDSDVRRIQKLYTCSENNQLEGFPYDIRCSFNDHCCGFRNAASDGWRWNRYKENEGYVYTTTTKADGKEKRSSESNEKTSDNTNYFVSVNFFGKRPNVNGEPALGCVRFWFVARGDGDVYLKLRQSYLSQPTQLTFLPEDTFDLWESENTTNTWSFLQVPLYVSNPFKLIFESSLGNSTEGLIALDDFELLFTPCEHSENDTSKQEHYNGVQGMKNTEGTSVR